MTEIAKHTLYHDAPAADWELGTPIGNGFMGAMLYGRTDREIISLAEESIWAGDKLDTNFPDFKAKIDETRRLFLEGKPLEADAYAKRELEVNCLRVKSQETAGKLILDFGECVKITDYRRELDLISGVSKVSYKRNNESIMRESFASYPDRVIATRITGAHSFLLDYERTEDTYAGDKEKHQCFLVEGVDPRVNVDSVVASGDTLVAKAHPSVGGKPFEVRAKIKTDGELSVCTEGLLVKNAKCTELYISIAVGCEAVIPEPGWDELYSRHVADFSALMDRASVEFPSSDPALAALSLDKRIERLKADKDATDPALIALYFDFGRYLLVASSRPGSLPANLQGVWNPYIIAPWNSDYHLNINLQMNYWHAESANLPECALPLFDYMNNNLLVSGRETAKNNYKCRGMVAHHLSDIYGFTSVADGVGWGFWQLGGAWLAYAMWEHYLYSGDTKFLRAVAYEYIRDCARFFLDFMFEDENGRLLSGPTMSPENKYKVGDREAHLCLSPTMDIEMIGGLLKFYIETEKLLGIDPAQADEARVALSKMPPLQIGKYGQLMEWLEDYDEPEPGHRHISHLVGLYPGCEISKETPELYAAAKKSLERRLAHGGGHTGWSCAWLIALYARLCDADGCSDTFRKLICESTRDSLLDSHPPFQIDGNFGATAALVEMLLQSHESKIELFPAYPEAWGDVVFTGLRARGGLEISARREGGSVSLCEVKAVSGDFAGELVVDGEIYRVKLKAGETWVID